MLTTQEDFTRAARDHGISLDPRKPSRLDVSGTDFLVLHATDADGTAWILRSPRRADVLQRARTERSILDLMVDRLPVAVPRWEVVSPELIAYRRLGGEPAAIIDMEMGGYVWRFTADEPPAEFTRTLAEVLAALHSVEVEAAAAAGIRRLGPAEIREGHSRRMDAARQILPVPEVVWARWQQWLENDRFWPKSATLVHGDLHPPHVLVDDDHRVVGVLDWTEAHIGDPATDFALFYATMGAAALQRVLSSYAEAGGTVWPHMADHVVEVWAAYPAVVAEFAATSGEEGPLVLARSLIEAQAASG